MKKTKLDIIKLNILTTILTLICISCDVDNDPEQKESANNFSNGSQNLKSQEKDTISKLKEIGKKLTAQEEKDTAEIATIDITLPDFLGSLKTQSYKDLSKNMEMNIKRILYSSLNYEIAKIRTLKEIIDKLKQNSEHQKVLERFLYSISLIIQFQLNGSLEKIKKKSNALTQENYKALLMGVESSLKLKENFEKALNKTIEAYSQDLENIKSDETQLVKHMDEHYSNINSFKPTN
ncbi:complement regulator-acquiring protein (plasmid) [Borreliella spielmanii]|uniref:Crasp-1 protein n=1 Tax=Borreliella spielmanii A14S TaxID=498742 RepID=C0RC75_9SPIR|nr:complement regulator-acquiring protein [Borreliella spielmanii]ACN53353.1 crasp-1 protein [Borreliella spielmanii A14S]WKC83104.1 complement regulator-acquiring protein [Borreliella spielmanii]